MPQATARSSQGRCSYLSMKTHMLSVTVASRDCRKSRPALARFMRPGTTPGHPGPKASQSTDAKHPKQKEEDLQNKV
eukprot:g67529.t1